MIGAIVADAAGGFGCKLDVLRAGLWHWSEAPRKVRDRHYNDLAPTANRSTLARNRCILALIEKICVNSGTNEKMNLNKVLDGLFRSLIADKPG